MSTFERTTEIKHVGPDAKIEAEVQHSVVFRVFIIGSLPFAELDLGASLRQVIMASNEWRRRYAVDL